MPPLRAFSFEEISNIVTQNDTNSQTGEKIENLTHEYENISMGQVFDLSPVRTIFEILVEEIAYNDKFCFHFDLPGQGN